MHHSSGYDDRCAPEQLQLVYGETDSVAPGPGGGIDSHRAN
jgi:hypothetical protein